MGTPDTRFFFKSVQSGEFHTFRWVAEWRYNNNKSILHLNSAFGNRNLEYGNFWISPGHISETIVLAARVPNWYRCWFYVDWQHYLCTFLWTFASNQLLYVAFRWLVANAVSQQRTSTNAVISISIPELCLLQSPSTSCRSAPNPIYNFLSPVPPYSLEIWFHRVDT